MKTRINNLKMKTKLLLSFGLVLGLAIVQSAMVYQATQTTTEVNTELKRVLQRKGQMYQVQASFITLLASVRGYTITHNPKFKQDYEAIKPRLAKQILELKDLTKNPTYKAKWQESQDVIDEWLRTAGDPQFVVADEIERHEKTLQDIRDMLARAHASETADKFAEKIKEQADYTDKRMKETEAQSASAQTFRTQTIVWGTLLLVAVSVGFAIFIARAVSLPLLAISLAARKLALGDADQQITISSRDEIGDLAQSFREVIDYNQTVATACEALGNGDLTITVEPKSEKDMLARNFTHAVEAVRSTIQQMAEGSANLAAASEELSATSSQMSANAEETAAQAGAVSTAAEEISANVQTVVHGSEQMTTSIREISTNAHEAAKVAGSGVKIAEEANEKVAKLDESSQEIGQVIKVITSIAEQTHLLALNATIEAARAGEAGKGFAVVANEVKELAKETAKATEDISRKIEAIQTDTKGAIEGIGEIGKIIAQINDIQTTIATAVEEQTATTNEISRNVTDVATGNQEVARNITGVAQAAKSTTEGAEYTNKAAGELAQLASTLQRLVGQFNLGENGRDSSETAQPVREMRATVKVQRVEKQEHDGDGTATHIKKAIAAHGAWKKKFRDFMDGKLDLDASKVTQNNACDFGKWLAGNGRDELGTNFEEINRLHTQFHHVAADVVRAKKTGNLQAANKSLSMSGDFGHASSVLTNRLMALSSGSEHPQVHGVVASASVNKTRDLVTR